MDGKAHEVVETEGTRANAAAHHPRQQKGGPFQKAETEDCT